MCGGPLKCGGPCSAEHVRTLVNPALDHYDDERDKIVFHKTIPYLQDQDQDRFFGFQTGLVPLRQKVSDHITTAKYLKK